MPVPLNPCLRRSGLRLPAVQRGPVPPRGGLIPPVVPSRDFGGPLADEVFADGFSGPRRCRADDLDRPLRTAARGRPLRDGAGNLCRRHSGRRRSPRGLRAQRLRARPDPSARSRAGSRDTRRRCRLFGRGHGQSGRVDGERSRRHAGPAADALPRRGACPGSRAARCGGGGTIGGHRCRRSRTGNTRRGGRRWIEGGGDGRRSSMGRGRRGRGLRRDCANGRCGRRPRARRADGPGAAFGRGGGG